MIRRTLRALAAAGLVIALAACSDGSKLPTVDLDGSPRLPDVEGVVTEVSREQITFEGGKSYPVAARIASFNTTDLRAVSLLTRKGNYVQAGVDDEGEIYWVASYGLVVPGSSPPSVYYVGSVASESTTSVTFEDGSVLKLAQGVAPPAAGARVRVEIDPAGKAIREVQTLTS